MAATNGVNGANGNLDKPEVAAAMVGRKINSRKRANIFSKLFFLWMMPLFRKGLKKDLTSIDICQPMNSDKSEPLADGLEQNWFIEISRAKLKGERPSLLKALIKTYTSNYIFDGVLIFIMTILCRPFQPVMLAYLVDYFSVGSDTTIEMAYVYAAGLVGLTFFAVFIQNHTILRQQQLGMRIRIAACSLVYRKVLRLNSDSLGKTTAGQLVNLMSNDVSRFDQVLIFLHYLWTLPIQVALICYLIYTRVSVAALIGVASITLQTVPVQSYMSKLSSNLRKKIAVRTDERVRLMSEVISGIQVIKMYAWEKPFEKVVSMARAHELSAITMSSYLRGIYMSFMVFTERASLYVTLLAYTLMGNKVTSGTVFSLAQFYNTLQGGLAIIYPTAISSVAECLVTIRRLEDFLILDEREDLKANAIVEKHINGQYTPTKDGNGLFNPAFDDKLEDSQGDENYAVNIRGVTARWVSDGMKTLDDFSVAIPKGKLCAIIGSVGSGKSSILQLLLKELTPSRGSVEMKGALSYASQEPWLFVATVRNNILFGLPYDHKRYREVVRVCALEKDFQQFPRGDQTLVGERGVSLSGGQRARINLARAVYREAEVYLLDDPLSAVDAHVGRHLFSECISKYLRGKTTILVTHQLHYLKTADLIVILKNGKIENKGTYDELASSGQDFARLLATLQESKEAHEQEEKQHGASLKRRVSAISTVSVAKSEMSDGEAEEEEAEELLTGGMKASVYWHYWKSGGSFCFVTIMIVFMIMGQLSATIADYWVTFWTNEQGKHDEALMKNATIYDVFSQSNDSFRSTFEDTQEPDLDIFTKVGPFTTAEYLYIYTAIIILCVTLTVSRSILFFKVCMNASKSLHDQMFHQILKGVMRFFDTNTSGRILNRFSKDIGAIDELLPKSTIEAVQIMLVMVSILVLVSMSNIWMMIPVVIIMVLFYYIFLMYLNTAQDIKRLEGITKSPVFSHLAASLSGITTIRASNASQRLSTEFDIHQDLHTSTWYQYLACSTTLGFWLDIICCIFLAVIAFSFVMLDAGDSLSGNVGLAISQALILTGMLQFGVRQAAEIVSQMTSVERVLQYNTIEQEKGLDKGEIVTPEKWPVEGAILFDHTFMKYSENDPPVLKDLNITIRSGWKVGIVGRTGAGKSSLISALFRLAKLEGGIYIDGIETKSISLQDLRSRISIIPQEPVLFSATVRYNLDPFNIYDDAAIWKSLEAVELKEAIQSLDFRVSEGGANFSLGQRQLVCLARAILRNNQILVLDEATANVDPQTDAFIQKTIREKFSHCTVLTIAHRLNTVMDSDRVLVMDTGCAAEFDHPHILLNQRDGILRSMVAETGQDMSANLHMAARKAYIAQGGESTVAVVEELYDEANSSNEDDDSKL